MILDPVAIFVLHWGVAGAAIATITGQIVTAVLAAWYLLHTKSFKLRKSSFGLHLKELKGFLPLGISSFLTQLSIVVIMGEMCIRDRTNVHLFMRCTIATILVFAVFYGIIYMWTAREYYQIVKD